MSTAAHCDLTAIGCGFTFAVGLDQESTGIEGSCEGTLQLFPFPQVFF